MTRTNHFQTGQNGFESHQKQRSDFPDGSLSSSPSSASTAILIAHLKLSSGELRQVLMNMSADRLEPAHIKQLLLYAPDDEEVKQYEQYDQDLSKLSEPDQFIFQVADQRRRQVVRQ